MPVLRAKGRPPNDQADNIHWWCWYQNHLRMKHLYDTIQGRKR